MHVDLNSDSGESFSNWQMGDDATMMQIVTSANIACGFHAGDASVMSTTVGLAAENNVAGQWPMWPSGRWHRSRCPTRLPKGL